MNNFNEEFKKMIEKMYENGESVANLSKDYEVSRPTIYNLIKHYKIIETLDGETEKRNGQIKRGE